jgi:menaquinone-9 beta-reductase
VHDLVIVGAGPAGSAAALAALTARPDSSVLLLDRASFPRDKACGDAIGPHAVRVLDALGASSALGGYPRVSRFELSDGHVVVRAPLRGVTYTVPRRVFDDRLRAAAVVAGARVKRHHVRRLERRGEHVVLDGALAARVVVAADGANSRIRRLLGYDRNPEHALAVAMRGYAPVGGPLDQRIMLDDAHWPAYGWSFAIGDGTANVGWGTTVAALRRLSSGAALRGTFERRVAAVAGGPVHDLRAHHLPLSTWRPPLFDGGVLLAGDAASLINPLSGEGIFYALLSGALAGRAAVATATPGPSYARALRRRLGRHLRHTRVASAMLDVPPVRRAGVRAAATPLAFHDLTELALGDGCITPTLAGALLRVL